MFSKFDADLAIPEIPTELAVSVPTRYDAFQLILTCCFVFSTFRSISPLQDDLDEAACELPQWSNDLYCDDGNNNAACNWDGGACCGCYVIKDFCEVCTCLDPNGEPNDDCPTTTYQPPQNQGSMNTTKNPGECFCNVFKKIDTCSQVHITF